MTDKISSTAAHGPRLQLVPKQRKTKAQEILDAPQAALAAFDFDEEDVRRLVGGSAANGDKNDPIVCTGKAENWMRGLIARYGFNRMPQTYGEFQALLEYCTNLDGVIGAGVVPPERALAWAKGGGIAVWEKHSPKYKEAARLFATQDLDGLRKYHAQGDVLTQLGKDFKEF